MILLMILYVLNGRRFRILKPVPFFRIGINSFGSLWIEINHTTYNIINNDPRRLRKSVLQSQHKPALQPILGGM